MPFETADDVSFDLMCFWTDAKPHFSIGGSGTAHKIDPYMSTVFQLIYGKIIVSE